MGMEDGAFAGGLGWGVEAAGGEEGELGGVRDFVMGRPEGSKLMRFRKFSEVGSKAVFKLWYDGAQRSARPTLGLNVGAGCALMGTVMKFASNMMILPVISSPTLGLG